MIVRGQYLLQLRDDKPDIVDPGQWGLFGGHINEGESIAAAIRREVLEETSMTVEPQLLVSMDIADNTLAVAIRYHIFYADVTDRYDKFHCNEGQRGQLFSETELDGLPMHRLTRDWLYMHEFIAIRKRHKVVMCHGVFDVLHYGHLLHFEAAKRSGDYLVVSMVADRFVQKGLGRPLFDERRRAKMLSALRIVDRVLITDCFGPFDHIRCLRPHVFAKGAAYEGALPEQELQEYLGGEVVFTPKNNIRSTELIDFMKKA